MDQHAGHAAAIEAKQPEAVNSMLAHQAEEAAERIRRCPELLSRFANCTHSQDCLGRALDDDADGMVGELMGLDADSLQNVMQAFCATFGELSERESDEQSRAWMAQATVALYLLCVCLLIRVQSPAHLSGIPRLDSDHAAHLFASLIATAMAGGKLVLKSDHARRMLVPEHCYAIQWRSVPDIELATVFGEGLTITPKGQFERELYLAVFRDELTPDEALDVGELTGQQRANLSRRLRFLRGLGTYRIAMSIVVFASEPPGQIDTALVMPSGIPVFILDHDLAYELLGGLSAEDFIAMLGELLRAVRNDIETLEAPHTHRPQDAQAVLDELRQELSGLIATAPDHPQVVKIREFLDAFEQVDHNVTPKRREILTDTRDAMEKLSDIADFGGKLFPRAIELLAQLSRYWPSS